MMLARDVYAVWRAALISVEEARSGADPELVRDNIPEWEHLRESERAAWGTTVEALDALAGTDWISEDEP